MSQEPAERAGTGWDDTGRGGILPSNGSGRLRGKGAILLGVSHRPARVRFPPPPLEVARPRPPSGQSAEFEGISGPGLGPLPVAAATAQRKDDAPGHPHADSLARAGSAVAACGSTRVDALTGQRRRWWWR